MLERCGILSGARSEPAGSRHALWIYFIVAGSLMLRVSVLDFQSGDYNAFLSRWYDYFVEHGRWASFKDDFSNYPPLYLYLLSLSTLAPLPKICAIKLISILSDYIAAAFIFKIVRYRFPNGPCPWVATALMLFLPTVWLNSGLWGQCDAMFTSGLLGTFFYLLIKRPAPAMVAFGLACSLKPQAIFFVPFLIGLYFNKQLSWKSLCIPPLVYTLCGVPAMIAGRPIWKVLLHWALQKNGNRPFLTMGATNSYQWISNNYYEFLELSGVVLAAVAAAFLVLSMQERVRPWARGVWHLRPALLSGPGSPLFSPWHARAVFLRSRSVFVDLCLLRCARLDGSSAR